MTRRPLASVIGWGLAVLLTGAIVHLSSILLLPTLATRDAYAKLAAIPVDSGLHAWPDGNGALPFTDSGVMLGVCRFDLRARPLRLRVDADREGLMTVSFHARNGVVFHTLTDRATLRGRLDVLLGTAAQIDVAEAADADDAAGKEIRLTAPSRLGFVLVRGMPSSASRTEALRRQFAQAECKYEDP